MDTRSGLRAGVVAGLISIFCIILGLTVLLGTIVQGWLNLPSQRLGAWLLLLGVAFGTGAWAVRDIEDRSPARLVKVGFVAAVTQAVMVALFVFVISYLTEAGVELRQWLVQLTPEAIELLTFGLPPVLAGIVVCALLTIAALAGTLAVVASERYGWRESLRKTTGRLASKIRSIPAVDRFANYKYARQIIYAVAMAALLIAPMLLGRYWNYALGTVGIYVMLGLGLNIVVGLAGLLDLGYVAFFAIGAYTVAILTAPTPHGIMMSWWMALPIGVLVAALSGVLLGVPVLRMRGDYLAIVTLGFGEIIRILSKSDVLSSFSGGPRGIRNVGGPVLFGIALNSTMHYMYAIIAGIALVAFVTYRLQNSRVGRAWMAMREDEDVAEAMGVFTLKYKLLAFAIGAAFAGLGGAIYASRNQFTGPEDFTLIVSINVLCLVIIGGMGSIPGVILGALVLKGLPEVLRDLDEYRMLFFGALLIFMMIVRPEGLFPSQRRKMELHETEDVPDEFLTAVNEG